MKNSYIKDITFYVPEEVLTNKDLSKMMDTSDEWIKSRTGIRQRHTVGDSNHGPADLAVKATTKLLDKCKMDKADIDFVVFSTSTPDFFVPGSGSVFQEKMGLDNLGVLDIRQGCSGFIYALSVADKFIKAETYNNILVIGSEVQTTQLDFDDKGRGTAVLFGDGAAACILSGTTENKGILSCHLHTDGKYINDLSTEYPSSKYKGIISENDVRDRKHHITMNGREVFKHAVRRFPEVILEGLEHNGLVLEDVGIVIPHQANQRITQAVQRQLEITDDMIFSNIHKYGNTTAASIGIALSEALDQNKIHNGDIVVLAAFGAGFYWGAVVIRW